MTTTTNIDNANIVQNENLDKKKKHLPKGLPPYTN